MCVCFVQVNVHDRVRHSQDRLRWFKPRNFLIRRPSHLNAVKVVYSVMGFILSLRYRTPRSNSLRVNAILLYDETFLYKKTMVFFYIRKEGIMPVAWRNNWETEFGSNLGKNWYRMNFMKIPVIEEFCFFKKILVFCNFGERRFSNRIYTNIWIHADGPIARWSISISNIRIAFVFFVE